MDHAWIDRPALHVIGKAIRTSNERTEDIGALWGAWMSQGLGAGIPATRSSVIVAAYLDYEGDHTQPFTFLLGHEVEPGTEAPEGHEAHILPAGRYARFDAEGEMPAALIQTWMGIWQAPLTRRFEADYELHDPSEPARVQVFVGGDATG